MPAQAEKALTDKYVGPNSYTYWGRIHVYGFTAPNSSGYIAPMTTLTNGANPTMRPNMPMKGGLWYEPWTWDWDHIMGQIWDEIWNACVHSALSSVVGTAGTTLATNLLARGAKIVIGPEGYAYLAFGSCLAGIVAGP